MLKVMLNIASSGKADYGRLVGFAALTAGGQLLFMASNFFYETTKMNIIRSVNMTLKEANLRYLIDQNSLDTKDGLSFMTNDLKQIETNRVTAQLDIIYQSLTFVGSLAFALYNSWEMTLVFIVATLAPAGVQMITSKIITKKSKIWTQKNAVYTSTCLTA